ncbi:MAG: potassium channel family protein [Nitrospirota bacterium]|nr:potassium channel family protein [Nitrospirota bacterium]
MLECRERLNDLYYGTSEKSVYFRFGLIAFDFVTISFFIVTSMVELSAWIITIDFIIAFVLSLDFSARLFLANNRLSFLIQPISLLDILVILALLAATIIENLAFLRVFRSLRLLRSYHLLRDLRSQYKFFARNEGVIQSVLNLFVFIFVVTALVYVFQHDVNPQISTYTDALYFTVTTLTTTGFGDITMRGDIGRLLAVVIMVLGVALFLKLLQEVFRPAKVEYGCPDCGLKRHDPDAVHCKHCGRTLHIETEGI